MRKGKGKTGLKRDKRSLLVILLFLVGLAAFVVLDQLGFLPNGAVSAKDEETLTYKGIARNVYDGDTFHMTIEGKDETVRIIGVDTPEIDDEAFVSEAKKSKQYTVDLIEGKEVWLVVETVNERDRYGRLLAFVWLTEPPENGKERRDGFIDNTLNGRLARDGYAIRMTIKPNTAYADQIEDAARKAEDKGLGLWPSGALKAS